MLPTFCLRDNGGVFFYCIARSLPSDGFEIPVKAEIWEQHIFPIAIAAACVLVYSFQSSVCLLSLALASAYQRFTLKHYLQILELRMRRVT